MKKLLLALLLLALLPLCCTGKKPPVVVPEKLMQEIYDEVKTPYKYGVVLAPQDSLHKVDCPTVFRHKGAWYMSYIVFDGRGYETWLAQSDDLLSWRTLGRILSSGGGGWDAAQKAGYPALQSLDWGGLYELQQLNHRYWLSYFGGDEEGYEAGLLSLGIAYTENDIATPHDWTRLPQPVLSSTDSDVRWWENRKLYKSTIIWDKKKITGHPFVMFYNANGDTTQNKSLRWFERIGMAVSDDMTTWKRYLREPVMAHSRGITGDATLQKIGELYVMFYFGAFWEGYESAAFNSFACSYDLVHWTDWKGPFLISSSEPYDALYAHKSFVVKHDGTVYHFYNAVDDKQNRCIALATSKNLRQPTN